MVVGLVEIEVCVLVVDVCFMFDFVYFCEEVDCEVGGFGCV